jgi:hypothetical protein
LRAQSCMCTNASFHITSACACCPQRLRDSHSGPGMFRIYFDSVLREPLAKLAGVVVSRPATGARAGFGEPWAV